MDQTAVAGRLVALAEAGETPAADELGDPTAVARELVALAGTPLAPLAAAALARTGPSPGRADWPAQGALFAQGLAGQDSVLALLDSADELLDSPALAPAAATALHDAMIAGLDRHGDGPPELAAARLEIALRVAIAGPGGVVPFRVLDRLCTVPAPEPPGYRKLLPRLLGVALDAWGRDTALTDPLRAVLFGLADDPQAGPDASFELGCDRLRTALAEQDSDRAVGHLRAAGDLFALAAQDDDGRDDAAAYLAVCQAVTAFADADADLLVEAAARLDQVLARRDAWHLNAHLPRWRRATRQAEHAWLRFVLSLRAAADRLAEPSWLDTASALGELGDVYRAERGVAPAQGLQAVVGPVVENAVAASAALADQLARAVAADSRADRSVLPPSARLLLAAVRARRTDRTAHGGADDDAEEPDPAAARARVAAAAPGLLTLPDTVWLALAALPADQLRECEALLPAPALPDHPGLAPVRARIIDGLSLDPAFTGETRAAVSLLTERTLTFLLDRYDRGGAVVPGRPNIIRPVAKGQPLPTEAELQYDFYVWLAAGWDLAGKAAVELTGTATGRADVVLRIGEIRLVTEVKRDDADASRAALESKYLAQAAEYSGSNVPFSQLLVLDLTDHTAGTPSLADCAWHAVHTPRAGVSPRNVVVAVVVANRPSPSALRAAPS